VAQIIAGKEVLPANIIHQRRRSLDRVSDNDRATRIDLVISGLGRSNPVETYTGDVQFFAPCPEALSLRVATVCPRRISIDPATNPIHSLIFRIRHLKLHACVYVCIRLLSHGL